MKTRNNQYQVKLRYFLILVICFVMIGGVWGQEDDNEIIQKIRDVEESPDKIAEIWRGLNENQKIRVWSQLDETIQFKLGYELKDSEKTELLKIINNNEKNRFIELIINAIGPEKDIKVEGLEKAEDIEYITTGTGEDEKTFLRLTNKEGNKYVIELKFLSKGKVSSITFNEEHGFLYEFKDGAKIYPGVKGYFEENKEGKVSLKFYGFNEEPRKLKLQLENGKLLDIDLTKTKEWENSEILYENDFLIISKGEGNSKQEHKIPLTNLPEDFKEISFKKNTNNPNDDYGIFYYDNNDNSVFINDGSWIEKHGNEASDEEKAYGKWIVKSIDGEETKTIGYLYPGENKGNTFQVGLAKAGEKRDIELPGLHIWDNPESTEDDKEGPHITTFDKQENQVSIFPTNKDKPIGDRYYAGFDPATSRIRGKMDLKIKDKKDFGFGKEDVIPDFSISITGTNNIVVTTDSEYKNEKYEVITIIPMEYHIGDTTEGSDESTTTIGYSVTIPDDYNGFNLELDEDTEIRFEANSNGRQITKVTSNGKDLYSIDSTKKESVPRTGTQTISGSGRVGNGQQYKIIGYRGILFKRRIFRGSFFGLREPIRVPIGEIVPEGDSTPISQPVRRNARQFVRQMGDSDSTDTTSTTTTGVSVSHKKQVTQGEIDDFINTNKQRGHVQLGGEDYPVIKHNGNLYGVNENNKIFPVFSCRLCSGGYNNMGNQYSGSVSDLINQ